MAKLGGKYIVLTYRESISKLGSGINMYVEAKLPLQISGLESEDRCDEELRVDV